MATIVAQLAPQRSTQYADLVSRLAPHEITLSSIAPDLQGEVDLVLLGGHPYIRFTIDGDLQDAHQRALQNLSMCEAFFRFYDLIAESKGPFLIPIELNSESFLPKSLISTRRYRGKTNELLLQFMCNIARYSSSYRETPWTKLTLLDPLSGGGTTLFAGLVLGADVVGVERDRKVAEGTAGFLKTYFKEERIPVKGREDRLKGAGKRWFFTVKGAVRCIIGAGDTTDVAHFVHGLKRPQLIVTDLPYGIQHAARWKSLLVDALPAWQRVLAPGGALAFSWNATRFSREEMRILVEEVSDFVVYNDPPYNLFSHRVDRVIKERDIIVARCK